MWKKLRRRAEKAIEKKKAELEKKEVPKLESKKEPTKKVDGEREKVDKAMERLRVFVPTTLPPICSTKTGEPVIEVYDWLNAYCDIQTILQYLMKKQEDK